MFGIISTILPVIGSAGFGSVLKMLAGFIESRNTAREAKERRKLAPRACPHSEAARKWHATAFGGDNASGRYARGTRRVIAVIGVLNFAALTVLGVLYPSAELVTFAPSYTQGKISVLWGLLAQ